MADYNPIEITVNSKDNTQVVLATFSCAVQSTIDLDIAAQSMDRLDKFNEYKARMAERGIPMLRALRVWRMVFNRWCTGFLSASDQLSQSDEDNIDPFIYLFNDNPNMNNPLQCAMQGYIENFIQMPQLMLGLVEDPVSHSILIEAIRVVHPENIQAQMKDEAVKYMSTQNLDYGQSDYAKAAHLIWVMSKRRPKLVGPSQDQLDELLKIRDKYIDTLRSPIASPNVKRDVYAQANNMTPPLVRPLKFNNSRLNVTFKTPLKMYKIKPEAIMLIEKEEDEKIESQMKDVWVKIFDKVYPDDLPPVREMRMTGVFEGYNKSPMVLDAVKSSLIDNGTEPVVAEEIVTGVRKIQALINEDPEIHAQMKDEIPGLTTNQVDAGDYVSQLPKTQAHKMSKVVVTEFLRDKANRKRLDLIMRHLGMTRAYTWEDLLEYLDVEPQMFNGIASAVRSALPVSPSDVQETKEELKEARKDISNATKTFDKIAASIEQATESITGFIEMLKNALNPGEDATLNNRILGLVATVLSCLYVDNMQTRLLIIGVYIITAGFGHLVIEKVMDLSTRFFNMIISAKMTLKTKVTAIKDEVYNKYSDYKARQTVELIEEELDETEGAVELIDKRLKTDINSKPSNFDDTVESHSLFDKISKWFDWEVCVEFVKGFGDIIIDMLNFKGSLDVTKCRNFVLGVAAIKGAKDIVGMVFKALQSAFIMAYEYIYQVPYVTAHLRAIVASAKEWVEETNKILETSTVETSINFEQANRVFLHMIAGRRISTQLVGAKLGPHNFQTFFTRLNDLKNHYEAAMANMESTKTRVRPLVISLFGLPSRGKSNLAQVLSADLYKLLYKKNVLPKNLIYDWNFDMKFWDGYANHFALMMDDYLQVTDAEYQTGVAMSLIRMDNDATMPLEMARADEKGHYFFRSRVIFTTANDGNIGSEMHIQSKDAFKRRRQIHAEVLIDDKYLSVDPISGAQKVDATDLDTTMWKIVLRDTINGEARSAPLTYEEFLGICFIQLVNRTDAKPTSQKMQKTVGLSCLDTVLFPESDDAKLIEKEAATTVTPGAESALMLNYGDIGFRQSGRGKTLEGPGPEECLKRVIKLARERKASEEIKPFTEKEKRTALQTLYNKLVELKNTAYGVVEVTSRFLKTHYIVSTSIGAAITGLGVLASVHLVNKYMSNTVIDNEVEAQITHSGDETTRGRKMKPMVVPKTKTEPVKLGRQVKPQSDDQANDIINKVKKNMCSLFLYGETTDVKRGCVNVTFIRGRSAVTSFHQFAILMDEITYIGFTTPQGEEYVFHANSVRLFADAEKDQCWVKFPTKDARNKTLSEFSNILKSIRKHDDKLDYDMSVVSLVVRRMDEPLTVVSAVTIPLAKTISYKVNADTSIELGEHFDFQAPTQAGDCGGFYVLSNTKCADRKILGMHVAGGKRGIGTWFDQEWFEECEERVKEDDVINSQYSDIKLGEYQKVLRTVPKGDTMFQPSSSEIKPSMAYEAFGPAITHPSRLRPFTNEAGERISPAQKAVLKSNLPDVLPSHPELGFAIAEALADKFRFDTPYRELTWDEAYNGVPSWHYVKPIKDDTSVGYISRDVCGKYNMPFPPAVTTQGRKAYLDITETQEGKHIRPKPEFQKCVEDLETLLDQEPAYDRVIFADLLKDARVSLKKYEAGDTRLFSGSPMDFLIVVRKTFAWFTEMCGRDHIKGRFGTGLDPHSEWDELANHLLFGHSDESKVAVLAGDGEKFDAHLRPYIQECNRRFFDRVFMNAGASDRVRKRVENILKTCNMAVHILLHFIYQAAFGNPSGQPLTTPVNGNSIDIELCYVFVLITGCPVQEVVDETRNNTTGDDHLFTFELKPDKPERKLVTMQRVAQELQTEFGLGYTDYLKRGIDTCPPIYRLGEVEYLKRSLKKIAGRRPPRLRPEVIDEMIYWVRGNCNNWDMTREQMIVALREWGYYDYKTFMEKRGKYNDFLRRNGQPPILMSYNDLQQLWLGHRPNGRLVLHVDDNNRDIWLDPTVTAQSSDVSGAEHATKVNLEQETHQLTTIDVTVGIEEIQWPKGMVSTIYKMADPYADQGLQSVLTRVYQVAKTTWISTQASGAVLLSLDAPKILFDVENIADKLRRFQFFRGGVELMIKLNSTDFHFGMLLIATAPYCQNAAGSGEFFSMYTATGNRFILMDANDSRMAKISLPYLSPSTYLDMADADSSPSFIGRVVIYVLNPLGWMDASTQPSVDVTIFARFVEPEVAGPTLRETFTKELEGFDKSIRSQSKEQKSRTEKGVITRTAERVAYVAAACAAFPALTEVAAPVAAIASAVAYGASLFGLSQPTLLPSVTPVTLTQGENHSIVRGGRTSEMLALDPENKVADSPVYFCTDRDYTLFQNYKMLPGLVDVTSFSGSTAAGSVFYSLNVTPLRCYNAFSGIYKVYHTTPLVNLTRQFGYWRGGMQYAFYITCPKFTTLTLGIAYLPIATTSISSFTSEYGDLVTKVVDIRGSTVINFTVPYLQDTMWQRTLDLQSANQTTPGNSHGFNGVLKFFLINKVTVSNNATNTTVYMNVFQSAAADFEVAQPVELDIGYTPYLPAFDHDVESQSSDAVVEVHDVRAMFASGFPTIVPARVYVEKGACMGETINSWKELGHRFDIHSTDTTTLTDSRLFVVKDPYVCGINQLTDLISLHTWIMRSFVMYRGSMVMRSYFKVGGSETSTTWSNDNLMIMAKPYIEGSWFNPYGLISPWTTGGAATMLHKQRPYIEYRLPYYANVPFVPSYGSPFPGEDHSYSSVVLTTIELQSGMYLEGYHYRAFGDDFSLGYPKGLDPLYHDESASKSKKIKGSASKTVKTKTTGQLRKY